MKWKSVVAISAVALAGTLVGSSRTAAAQRKQTYNKTTNLPAEQSNGAAPSSCALLPISLLEKTFGEKFDDQSLETKMPPAYDGAWGTTCKYSPKPPFTKKHPTTVDFTIFTEASAAKAKETYDKVAAFLDDKSKTAPSGLGDEAYWQTTDDEEPQLHVLKGKTHYSIGVQPANEKQLLELARDLSARL